MAKLKKYIHKSIVLYMCKVLMLFDRRNFSEYLGKKLCYL